MEFEENLQLCPDNIFLDILSFLPLIDRVRLRRVNSRWRSLCELCIQLRASTLDFFCSELHKIDDATLRYLLQLCHRNLIEIRFSGFLRWKKSPDELAALTSAFNDFSYHKLCRLYFSENVPPLPTARRLITNSPGLQILTMVNYSNVQVLHALENVGDRLEVINLGWSSRICTSATLETLANNCRRLKRLNATFHVQDDDAAKLGEFFRRCSRLESLELYNVRNCRLPTILALSDSFWTLKNLKSLSLRGTSNLDANDQFFKAISVSFPLLQTLNIWVDQTLTDEGVSALAELAYLRDVEMYQVHRLRLSYGIVDIARRGVLQRLCLSGDIKVDANTVKNVERCYDHGLDVQVCVEDAMNNIIALIDNCNLIIKEAHFLGKSYYKNENPTLSQLIETLMCQDWDSVQDVSLVMVPFENMYKCM